MNGITFQADCLIGAEDVLERWVCNAEIPYFATLAWRGILTEVFVGLLIVVLFISLVLIKKSRK